jgi:hypothetical protein
MEFWLWKSLNPGARVHVGVHIWMSFGAEGVSGTRPERRTIEARVKARFVRGGWAIRCRGNRRAPIIMLAFPVSRLPARNNFQFARDPDRIAEGTLLAADGKWKAISSPDVRVTSED